VKTAFESQEEVGENWTNFHKGEDCQEQGIKENEENIKQMNSSNSTLTWGYKRGRGEKRENLGEKGLPANRGEKEEREQERSKKADLKLGGGVNLVGKGENQGGIGGINYLQKTYEQKDARN